MKALHEAPFNGRVLPFTHSPASNGEMHGKRAEVTRFERPWQWNNLWEGIVF